jgi:XTP/dITP diphosphohydrolase
MTIWFASGNIHKKKELSDILSSVILSADILSAETLAHGEKAWELKIPAEAGLQFAPEETGNSFIENALIKAEALYYILLENNIALKPSPVVIADDSGLCVDALGGRPGINSARYNGCNNGRYCGCNNGHYCDSGVIPASSKKLSDAERNTLLLAELGDNPLRKAHFVCSMALYLGPNRFFAAQETLEGELVKNASLARGIGGFGYDPILFIPEMGRTVAELSEEEKNQISHRGKAARAIAKILANINVSV